MGKLTSEDYLARLEEVEQGEGLLDAGEMSEAERMALMAEPPKVRADGEVMGSPKRKVRPLTIQQMKFVEGVIQGKTYRQAYRDAYPNDTSKDSTVSASAQRLLKHPEVRKRIEDGWDQTVEVLIEDVGATKRYVLSQLLHHAREAKQEGTKLKALELMGKSVGLFSKAEADDDKGKPDAERLKRELAGHLKLLDNVKPIKVNGQ